MASTVTQRAELAKFCSSRDWSKAIRVLDSLLSQSCVIQDICNRAYCYSQLELHKHVIKDCDRALQLDRTLLQAYILKGRAYSALGRKDDAVMVWEQGYEYAVCQSADLKQLLELEELLTAGKQSMAAFLDKDAKQLSEWSVSKPEPANSGKSSETFSNHTMSSLGYEPCGDSREVMQIESKPNEISYVPNGSSKKVEGSKSFHVGPNGNCDKQQNGTYNLSVEFGARSEARSSTSDSRNKSDLSTTISSTPGKSSDIPEIRGNWSDKSDMRSEPSNDAKGNKKFSVTRISKAKSINVDFRLSRGIAQVNEGQYARAISIFDQILREDPTYPEALIGRGTAYAFKRELDSAIADFTKAIQSNPSAGEAWKRRGQARAALGESVEAIADLTKSLEFEPDSADILHERGIVNFKLKDFYAATEDLSACVKLDKDNKSAYTYLGLALSSVGEYKKAEEAHMKAIQVDQKFLEAWGHLAQFYQDLANSEKALDCLQQVLQIDARFAKGYHLRGLLLHAMGDHRNAIKDLSIGLSIERSNIECLYLRASCHHAVGEYKEAVKDYDAALDLELDSMDKFVLQCLAFYQKEIALYTSAKINSEFCWFDIDGDIDPLFKEYWCKRLHPKNVCEKVYRQPPLRKAKLRKQDFTLTKPKIALLHAADRIGKTIQYHCSGFLANRRQHRMAGLAAIEIAQKVSKVWRSLQSEWRFSTKNTSKSGKRPRRKEKIIIPSHNRGGVGCSTSSYSEASTSSALEEKSSGRSVFSWLHLYSMAVKWRQISEPCDPVVWVNKLSEEFNSGFGSHTPLILGQTKVIRYYPHFQRTLDVAKAVMKENGFVCNAADAAIDLSKDGKLEEILKAESCSDLYKVVGEDFWLATWCKSTAFEGRRLEGTRITLVKTGERGFDFAIRTPCTPARWEDFDAEMASAWEVLCNSYCGETYGSNDFGTLENVREAILRMTYYWYNFMPLSRGSAAVGFTVMLGLLLAANMEFAGSIPEGRQVDWDAILSLEPKTFMESVKSWLYPSLKVSTTWKDIPDVTSTLETTGSVVAALSSFSG
ncbi:suppressor of RPS4-RLD 1 isoform X1 [Cynara cardunculus var. scolymus]|uniref:suppressor of RPS4-RLD 1 isoform X1 n=1 Tax=Cynara cardunculus var. scolymus TaxID=59895 RepID=UPI000D62895F|nr:suppressor of RPS4-RLD 1 isoform X1 [Cynara cardunculus var. scolymus]